MFTFQPNSLHNSENPNSNIHPNKSRISTKSLNIKSSKNLILNHQRLQKIKLKTLQLICRRFENNSHFQEKQRSKIFSNQKICEEKTKTKIYHTSFGSIAVQQKNRLKIVKDAKIVQKSQHQSKQNIKLHQKTKKLNKIKSSSTDFDFKIQSYQKQVIDKLADLNCIGNQWLHLNTYDSKKIEWRKRNKSESQSTKAGQTNNFFVRKLTTNYEYERQKIVKRINNLQLNGKINSKSENKSFQYKNKEIIPNNKIKFYVRQNNLENKIFNNLKAQRAQQTELKLTKSTNDSSQRQNLIEINKRQIKKMAFSSSQPKFVQVNGEKSTHLIKTKISDPEWEKNQSITKSGQKQGDQYRDFKREDNPKFSLTESNHNRTVGNKNRKKLSLR